MGLMKIGSFYSQTKKFRKRYLWIGYISGSKIFWKYHRFFEKIDKSFCMKILILPHLNCCVGVCVGVRRFEKMTQNIFSLLWSTIWILGMLYTILIVEQNVSEYLSYPAFIAQRSEERGYIFPKIRICSNSMHSRWVKF